MDLPSLAIVDRRWKLDGAHAALLDALASLVDRGGAARFLDAVVVPADESAFPGPWRPTWAGCESLLVRMLWHAYVDLEVVLRDQRTPAGQRPVPRATVLVWLRNAGAVATFSLRSLGPDDVAGVVATQIGRAFAASIASDGPYRNDADTDISPREGEVAAIYLGLGVLVAHAIAAPPIAAAPEFSLDIQRGVAPGLSLDDACYLLAVQAVVRGAPIAAHASLPRAPRELVRARIAELAPHRAALVTRLGLDLEAPRPALARAAAPRVIAETARHDRWSPLRHQGEVTYRIGRRDVTEGGPAPFFAGGAAGVVGGIVFHLAPVFPLTLGLAVGALSISALRDRFRRRRVVDGCVLCGAVLSADAEACPGCGATIAGRVQSLAEARERGI
ncbi:MAG: hypothetical protein K8W52_02405 [Deltaproteobacteria bacterium]|nr:hypothetical protein [Deltaproteobacteria bacterium]